MSSEKTDAAYVGNYRPNELYKALWREDKGAYISVVFEEISNEPSAIEIHPEPNTRNRIKVRLSWVKKSNEITEIEIKKFKYYKKDGWKPACDDWEDFGIKIKPMTLGLIAEFLRALTDLDINEIKQRRMNINVDGDVPLDNQLKKQLRTYLSKEGGREFIQELLATGFLHAGDIVNVGYRRAQLKHFESMLIDQSVLKSYADEQKIPESNEEAIWQRFFERNKWILGYGLDYRFLGLLQSQPVMSSPEANGSDSVISDFLLGDNRFLTFVEIKKPSTPLFGKCKNRSRSWRLSSEFFESISQILEQKASGQRFYESGPKYDKGGVRIVQQPHDSKVILIIGNWSEILHAPEQEQDIKKRTLELFRRDSRNVEIHTYDELLERARFIVEHSTE